MRRVTRFASSYVSLRNEVELVASQSAFMTKLS
jgi:hypothetical protein